MIRQKAFTLVELLVVIAIIALIMAILFPLLAKAREQGKRIVCLSNLRQLAIAWTSYAQINSEKLVNGAPVLAGAACPPSTGCSGNYAASPPPSTHWIYPLHQNELPWVGPGWGTVSEACQKCAIKTGALWSYVKQEKLYHCPTGLKNALISYPIIDSMNGKYMYNGCSISVSSSPANLCLKMLTQVKKPSERFVFLDEGVLTPDSYAVNYSCPLWFDAPAMRHDNGTNASFADGHSARLMWRADETNQAGKNNVINFTPATCIGKNDLYNMQMRCWGQVGYMPDSACAFKLLE